MHNLFVVAHQEVYLPTSDILFLINPDSEEGEHIAEKSGYSELRAHYHIWKTEFYENNLVGFFQFRRYLDLSAEAFIDLSSNKRPLPYRIKKFPIAKNYTQGSVDMLDSCYDVIAPIKEFTGIPVWKRYEIAPGHNIEDLQLVYEILSQKSPEYRHSADLYLNGSGEYYGNIYIMRRTVFCEYCAWLFDILDEYDSRAKNILPRTQGYLAERLFGIWFTKAYTDSNLRCAELPRLHFWGYDDKNHNLHRDERVNFFLPPGSKRRIWVRKLMK